MGPHAMEEIEMVGQLQRCLVWLSQYSKIFAKQRLKFYSCFKNASYFNLKYFLVF